MHDNMIADTIKYLNKEISKDELSIKFIMGMYSEEQILNMLTYAKKREYYQLQKNLTFLALMQPGNVTNTDEETFQKYLDNQKELNFVVLQMLYNVAYEHDDSNPDNITRKLRVEKIKSKSPVTKKLQENKSAAFFALKDLNNIFTRHDNPYLYTLPPFALYDIFQYPRNHNDNNGNGIKHFIGYDPDKTEIKITNYISSILYDDQEKCRDIINNTKRYTELEEEFSFKKAVLKSIPSKQHLN